MSQNYYVASCYFTAHYPTLSKKILEYISTFEGINSVRCCIPNFRIKENSERITNTEVRNKWDSLPSSAEFTSGDTVYSLCHNCTNILDEQQQGLKLYSLWELIDNDNNFNFPDYSGMKATIQDCWRARDKKNEQKAVRSILSKMNIEFIETVENHEDTNFCGSTLYREQPEKNSKYAPKHYIEQAKGKFLPHTKEEQIQIMKDYCKGFKTEIVICYCHYCLEGLLQGGVKGKHLAELLFNK